ncbi:MULTISPECIES: DUF397 domain-containing protein [unclassified Streptomyces]|uniref:DUF397 domain-containing protein n=1 Tax=unclassified Streptomyces TaxID=2593676 RepID=UPI00332ADA93
MRISNPEFDLSAAVWHKSSYSGGDGSNCLEMATWRKSTYSDGSGGNCLEVADSMLGVVPVRDSKNHDDGPELVFRAAAWSAFVAGLKRD